MELSWTWIIIITTCILYIYRTCKDKHSYWAVNHVQYLEPLPLFGSILPVFLFKRSLAEIYRQAYDKFPNAKWVGLYELFKPVLVVRDPQIIEKILVKDFQHFTDHSQIIDDHGLLAQGLFNMKGAIWRAVRYKLSPSFTTGKLKLMFDGMKDCSRDMLDTIRKNLNKDYEVKFALKSYTMDVIANVVFGLEITNQEAKETFGKMGSSVFNISPKRFINLLAISLFPKIAFFFKIQFLSPDVSVYFTELIKNTFAQRKIEKYQRNDYIQHLLRLKEKGSIEIQTKEEDDSYLDLDAKPPTENIDITDQMLYGQAFQFLTAGFEPLFNTILFALYDLSRFPAAQDRARQEIKEVLEKNGGQFTYEVIKDMTYVDQCIQETLRLHPLTPFMFRQCTKRYLTDDGLVIEKGHKVIIPLHGIHMDPKYHKDPETFNPDRLPPNNIRNSFTYLPFGDGPRMCIGVRFAMLELKIGLIKLLENFKFTLSPQTKVPYEVNKQAFIPVPISKIMFNISAIK